MTNHPNTPTTFILLLLAAALSIGYLIGSTDRTTDATIGGDEVPRSLDCEEDEVIGYNPDLPTPRTLTCVHLDIFENRAMEKASS